MSAITISGWGWQEYRKRLITGEEIVDTCVRFNRFQHFLWRCWLVVLRIFAPGNLNIREYVLRDLASGKPDNARKICRVMKLLAPEGVWLEGATYWFEDTCSFLDVWLDEFTQKFEIMFTVKWRIKNLSKIITDNFRKLSYKDAQGIWRPPPMGDVADRKIEALQGDREEWEGTIGNIKKSKVYDGSIEYVVDTAPVRLNWHCQADWDVVYVVNGDIDSYYKFFIDNAHKYKNLWAEIVDSVRWVRIKNLIGWK